MTTDLLTLLGGIGLFLFGMQTMTQALRELASDRMRGLLAGFTRTPGSGAVTGALTTAVIQSSSATMVMTVGFVGAGLLTFPQALGILYGASVGTTFTGWIVLILGFKLKLGTVALPLLFVASLFALLSKGQLARMGQGLAGFALVFIGLDMMQAAMAGYEGQVTPADFPSPDLAGRILLIGIGIAVTMVTQSSSAGVAAVLVLLSGQAIEFEQAAALVIGMHVGTSFTAFLAAIGGNRAVQQTAVANVLYHAAGGLIAIPLIDVFAALARAGVTGGDPQLALVLFHTGFNLVGAALMLPLTPAFAEFIQRLLPERVEARPASRLDRRLLADSGAALDIAGSVLREVADGLFAALAAALRPGAPPERLAMVCEQTAADLEALQDFLSRIQLAEDRSSELQRLNAQLQELDHLRRLQHRCTQAARLRGAVREHRLGRAIALLRGVLIRRVADTEPTESLDARLERLEWRLERIEARVRHSVLRHPPYVLGLTVAEVVQLSDAIRWLRRTTHHVARILHYQGLAWRPPERPTTVADAAPDLAGELVGDGTEEPPRARR
jgi:phosphate:Na+ symporter